ncbi:MAG TPA: hypothetical protein VNI84_18995 [Pyrinomonadaceae bacterium]|nr:hypothetical protein [Pyrinomonadaceae bacterium]
MNNENSDLIYLPAPAPVLSDFAEELKKIVGECPTGETYLRFSWGMDVTERWGEDVVHRYPDPDDKHVALPRFVMEGWQSPEVYDRAEWKKNIDVLGDFPERGVWDFVSILQTDDGDFLPLGTQALNMAYESRFWRSKGRLRAVSDLLDNRARLRQLKDKRFEARKAAIMDDFIRDYSNTEQNIKNAEFSKNASRSELAIPQKQDPNFKRTDGGLFIPR